MRSLRSSAPKATTSSSTPGSPNARHLRPGLSGIVRKYSRTGLDPPTVAMRSRPDHDTSHRKRPKGASMKATVDRHRRAAHRSVAAIAACAAVLSVVTPSAQAGPLYTIKTAPSPSSAGGPIQGGGSWITNKPSGYYLGRATVGSRFNVVPGVGATWHYGRAIDTVDLCGWVMPGSLGTRQGQGA